MSDSEYPQLKFRTSKIVKRSFKIVIVGESGVGKSSLLSQFVHGSFISDFLSTIGIDFGTKTINISNEAGEDENPAKCRILLKIFDTAGQKRFRTISEHYQSNNVDGVVVVVDITSALSFETASEFISRARELSGRSEDLPTILIGNKKDLADTRCVSHEKLEALARKYDVEYREISVKESLRDCEDVFELITRKIIHSRQDRSEDVVIRVEKHTEPNEISTLDRIFSKLSFCICRG